MSYLDKNLLPSERILFRTKKHFIIFLSPMIWTFLALLFYIQPSPQIQKLTFIIAIAALIYWANKAIEYYFSEFAVTNIRIIMREGFFYTHTNDSRLSTIANVSVNQSLLGRFLNYGTVVINTFGGGKDPFQQVDFPMRFQKALQKQLYLSQKK